VDTSFALLVLSRSNLAATSPARVQKNLNDTELRAGNPAPGVVEKPEPAPDPKPMPATRR